MGALTREKGVLKLVHPGRSHEENPRHCVTRTDVFEFPWIVVKPEAVLVPGNVFLVVPNRTVHDLLKAKGHHWQPGQMLGQQASIKTTTGASLHQSGQMLGQHPSTKAITRALRAKGTTTTANLVLHGKCSHPKIKSTNRIIHNPHRSSQMLGQHPSTKDTASALRVKGATSNLLVQDKCSLPKIVSTNKYFSPVIGDNKRTQQKLKRQILEDSTTEIRFSHTNESYYSSNKISTKLAKTEDLHLESECGTSKQVTKLKSCLRKPDSFRKFLHLRVDVDLPINDELQEKRLSVCTTEIADFLDW
ncbi:hypothetical protein I3760_03G143400 [Carya illinoinensis]|nr:hypothetical protein I3760_03G143400 [Carya illinoinensis]